MKQILIVISVSAGLLTACSSSELSYDPVELIEYERCLNTVPSNFEGVWELEGVAESYCKDKKPVLK